MPLNFVGKKTFFSFSTTDVQSVLPTLLDMTNNKIIIIIRD